MPELKTAQQRTHVSFGICYLSFIQVWMVVGENYCIGKKMAGLYMKKIKMKNFFLFIYESHQNRAKHLDCLLVKGCNSMLEILGSMLILFTSLLSPSFPFAIYQLIQEKKKVLMRFK